MALSPADFAAALKTLLAPAGVPTGIGTIKYVSDRSPEVPYIGITPALFIYPEEWLDKFEGAHSKMQTGVLALTYLDTLPSEQNVTLAAIETAMWSNYGLLVARIRSDIHWGGAVTDGGTHMQGKTNPQGPIRDEAGTPWVCFELKVSYRGPLEHV